MLQLFFWNKHCVCFGKQHGESACKAVQRSKIRDFENVMMEKKNKLKNKKLWIFQFNKNNSTSISPQHTTPHHIFKKLIIEKSKTIILNLRRLKEMPPVFFSGCCSLLFTYMLHIFKSLAFVFILVRDLLTIKGL